MTDEGEDITPGTPQVRAPQDRTAGPWGIRAGDRERSQTLDVLGSAFADGYITLHEFDARSQAAAVAKSRGELQDLVVDLPVDTLLEHNSQPANTDDPSLPPTSGPTAWMKSASVTKRPSEYVSAEHELNDLMHRGQLIKRIDGVVWTAATVIFFASLFLSISSYGWAVFPLAAMVSWGVHEFLGFDDDDEKIFDSLEKDQRKQRRDRLKIAAEKRKELGQ